MTTEEREKLRNQVGYFSLLGDWDQLVIIIEQMLQKEDIDEIILNRALAKLAENYTCLEYVEDVVKSYPNETFGLASLALKEQKYFFSLSPKQRKLYLRMSHNGKQFLKEGEIEKAVFDFKRGYAETGLPIFLYYMGKVSMALEDFDAAAQYFIAYVQKGFSKLSDSFACLAEIQDIREEVSEYERAMSAYYFPYRSKNNIPINIERYKEIQQDKLKLKKMKQKKRKKKFTSQVPLEDVNVLKKEESKIEDTYQMIREMYLQGRVKDADAALKKLVQKKDKTPKEKEIILSLTNNKTLFIRQGKIR